MLHLSCGADIASLRPSRTRHAPLRSPIENTNPAPGTIASRFPESAIKFSDLHSPSGCDRRTYLGGEDLPELRVAVGSCYNSAPYYLREFQTRTIGDIR